MKTSVSPRQSAALLSIAIWLRNWGLRQSTVRHQTLKAQLFSVGLFFGRNPNAGAVSGHLELRPSGPLLSAKTRRAHRERRRLGRPVPAGFTLKSVWRVRSAGSGNRKRPTGRGAGHSQVRDSAPHRGHGNRRDRQHADQARQGDRALCEQAAPSDCHKVLRRGAHHWARELTALGHSVRLLHAKVACPFVTDNKTDATDAKAIWLTVQQPGVKLVSIKTVAQQATLTQPRQRPQ